MRSKFTPKTFKSKLQRREAREDHTMKNTLRDWIQQIEMLTSFSLAFHESFSGHISLEISANPVD